MAQFNIYKASAGSGKTYTLVKEYVKKCLSSQSSISHKSLLAITFTNKAASEMKDRVLFYLDQLSKKQDVDGVLDWLKNYKPIKDKIEDIKTATLWKKKKSTFAPDYCAVKLPDNPWIVQPFEIYEEIRIEDIKKKHQK